MAAGEIMITRRAFLCGAGALALAPLAGCAAEKTAESTASVLEFDHAYELDYAKQFTADYYKGGYAMLTVASSGDKFFVVPEDAAVPEGVPQEAVVLQRPIENIYLVSSSVMDMFICLDELGSIRLSGTKADGWYLPEAQQAMEAGDILYAGKYSAPDYEQILAEGCGLAIENTMIYHTPEVKEELEQFGIPVIVERSSYESGPIERMEWVKFYGVLLGCEQKAEQVFDSKLAQIEPVLGAEPTGKTVAFFSITTNNLATVREGDDYIAQMINMAGGSYVFADLKDESSNLATVNLPLETFYAEAKDADILIYNGAIEGEVKTLDELTAKCAMLADFKAVQQGGCVYCTTKNLFQHSMEMSELIVEMNIVFSQSEPEYSKLDFLQPVE